MVLNCMENQRLFCDFIPIESFLLRQTGKEDKHDEHGARKWNRNTSGPRQGLGIRYGLLINHCRALASKVARRNLWYFFISIFLTKKTYFKQRFHANKFCVSKPLNKNSKTTYVLAYILGGLYNNFFFNKSEILIENKIEWTNQNLYTSKKQ